MREKNVSRMLSLVCADFSRSLTTQWIKLGNTVATNTGTACFELLKRGILLCFVPHETSEQSPRTVLKRELIQWYLVQRPPCRVPVLLNVRCKPRSYFRVRHLLMCRSTKSRMRRSTNYSTCVHMRLFVRHPFRPATRALEQIPVAKRGTALLFPVEKYLFLGRGTWLTFQMELEKALLATPGACPGCSPALLERGKTYSATSLDWLGYQTSFFQSFVGQVKGIVSKENKLIY